MEKINITLAVKGVDKCAKELKKLGFNTFEEAADNGYGIEIVKKPPITTRKGFIIERLTAEIIYPDLDIPF